MTGNTTRPARLDHSCPEFAALADSYTILRGEVGSRVHGLGTEDSDRDVMGVLVEPPRYVIGLDAFEQYQYRTAPVGERSGPGDMDATVYSLRKWARLAGEGNPSQVLLAFLPTSAVLEETTAGAELRGVRHVFLSRQMADRYIGYVDEQRGRMQGRNGRVNRPELIEQFGWDVKFGMHMVRLGWQGVELLTRGELTLPMPQEQRDWLLACRAGFCTMAEALRLADDAVADLTRLRHSTTLPERVDWQGVNTWLRHTYVREWTRHGLLK